HKSLHGPSQPNFDALLFQYRREKRGKLAYVLDGVHPIDRVLVSPRDEVAKAHSKSDQVITYFSRALGVDPRNAFIEIDRIGILPAARLLAHVVQELRGTVLHTPPLLKGRPRKGGIARSVCAITTQFCSLLQQHGACAACGSRVRGSEARRTAA